MWNFPQRGELEIDRRLTWTATEEIYTFNPVKIYKQVTYITMRSSA